VYRLILKCPCVHGLLSLFYEGVCGQCGTPFFESGIVNDPKVVSTLLVSQDLATLKRTFTAKLVLRLVLILGLKLYLAGTGLVPAPETEAGVFAHGQDSRLLKPRLRSLCCRASFMFTMNLL